jgi:hypothetical protein
MGKPVVRIVLDKDALFSLFPKEKLEQEIAFDNSVCNLLHETIHRIVKLNFWDALIKEFEETGREEISSGWGSPTTFKETVKKALELRINTLARDRVTKIVDELEKAIDTNIRDRLATADRLITQHTTP